MKFALLFSLLFPMASFASDLSDSNCLFDLAEQTFPDILSSPDGATFISSGFLVRQYSDPDVVIGTKDGDFYAYGDLFNGLLYVGRVAEFVPLDIDGDELLTDLFANGQSDVQVQGEGIVIAVLSDDLQGDRHQRFIVKLATGQTLLVAHNIDLAPRVAGLSEGDSIAFFGEYEWNDKGGVMHWTHYDPDSRHIDGWLQHKDILYQKLK